jgi:hypothetical protein
MSSYQHDQSAIADRLRVQLVDPGPVVQPPPTVPGPVVPDPAPSPNPPGPEPVPPVPHPDPTPNPPDPEPAPV